MDKTLTLGRGLLLATAVAISLGGCSTYRGVKSDMSSLMTSIGLSSSRTTNAGGFNVYDGMNQ